MTSEIYQCPGCCYQFNELLGDEYEGYPPGTKFESLPDDYVCPDCAVCNKQDFIPVEDQSVPHS
ncbi:MAG: rubredoxin [Pseudohongiella sp.]|nr:rubredoxin [Pseudohongiella sp.]